MIQRLLVILFAVNSLAPAIAQNKHTLSGYIKDASNGEALIGATLFLREVNTGAVANAYGFYSITVPSGTYNVIYSFVGFEKIERQITLDSDQRIDIELMVEATQLTEVVVNAKDDPLTKVQNTEMSTRSEERRV